MTTTNTARFPWTGIDPTEWMRTWQTLFLPAPEWSLLCCIIHVCWPARLTSAKHIARSAHGALCAVQFAVQSVSYPGRMSWNTEHQPN